MNTHKVIVLAHKNLRNGAAMESSAEMCLTDAIALYENGDYGSAKRRALDSLKYSVGILHADYKRAAK